jgi:hypothetical protein
MKEGYETKDSGAHAEYESGMKRDTEDGKPRYDLCFVKCMPYDQQLLTRYAHLRSRGAIKYCEDYTDINCEKAHTEEELARFKSSAFRHFGQWMCGEVDEDHAAATLFNIQMAEMVKWKLDLKIEEERDKALPFEGFNLVTQISIPLGQDRCGSCCRYNQCEKGERYDQPPCGFMYLRNSKDREEDREAGKAT